MILLILVIDLLVDNIMNCGGKKLTHTLNILHLICWKPSGAMGMLYGSIPLGFNDFAMRTA